MQQYQRTFAVKTEGQGLYDMSREVQAIVDAARIRIGLATVFCRHTSCSLIINENANPDVRHDLEVFLKRLVPEDDPAYIHTLEGPDDMPAHIKTALTSTSLSIPIAESHMVLGTWQGIYLFEHRSLPHRREIVVHVLGE